MHRDKRDAIVFGITTVLLVGAYWYIQREANAPTMDTMEGAVELNVYDDENGIIDVYPVPGLDEEQECICYNYFVNKPQIDISRLLTSYNTMRYNESSEKEIIMLNRNINRVNYYYYYGFNN